MDSIYAFIKGPGWFPGTPRLGDPMGVPAVSKLFLQFSPAISILIDLKFV